MWQHLRNSWRLLGCLLSLLEREANSPIKDNIHYQQLVLSLFEQSVSKFELLRKYNRVRAERRHCECGVNYSYQQDCTKSPCARKLKSYNYSRENLHGTSISWRGGWGLQESAWSMIHHVTIMGIKQNESLNSNLRWDDEIVSLLESCYVEPQEGASTISQPR